MNKAILLIELGLLIILGILLLCGADLRFLVYSLTSISILAFFTKIKASHFFSPYFWGMLGILLYLVVSPLGLKVTYSDYPEWTYFQAYQYAIIAVLAFLLPFLLIDTKNDYLNADAVIPDEKLLVDAKSFRLAALFFIICGYIFFLYSYSRVGGLFTGLFMHRGTRADLMSKSYGSIPYGLFLNVGFACYLFSIIKDLPNQIISFKSFGANSLLIKFILLLSPIVIYQLIEGERSSLIRLVIILGGILSLKLCLSFNFRSVALFCSVFLLLSMVGYFRGPIALSVREGNMNAIHNRINQASFQWLFPREFSAAYFSHTTSVFFQDPPALGTTYLWAFPHLLPRSIYPGKKPEALSHAFGQKVARLVNRGRYFGVGFSPLAEAYINFRTIGVVGVFLLFSFAVINLPKMLLSESLFLKIFYFLTLPMTFMFFRVSFLSLLRYVVYCGVILFLLLLTYGLIRELRTRKERQFT